MNTDSLPVGIRYVIVKRGCACVCGGGRSHVSWLYLGGPRALLSHRVESAQINNTVAIIGEAVFSANSARWEHVRTYAALLRAILINFPPRVRCDAY